MERLFNHANLGKTKVLMSYQRVEEGKDLPKVIALVSSGMRPVESTKWSNLGEVSYKKAYNNQGNCVDHYYLMWGTDYNFRESGYTHITTPSGRKASFKTALKIFNEARKATEFINIQKI